MSKTDGTTAPDDLAGIILDALHADDGSESVDICAAAMDAYRHRVVAPEGLVVSILAGMHRDDVSEEFVREALAAYAFMPVPPRDLLNEIVDALARDPTSAASGDEVVVAAVRSLQKTLVPPVLLFEEVMAALQPFDDDRNSTGVMVLSTTRALRTTAGATAPLGAFGNRPTDDRPEPVQRAVVPVPEVERFSVPPGRPSGWWKVAAGALVGAVTVIGLQVALSPRGGPREQSRELHSERLGTPGSNRDAPAVGSSNRVSTSRSASCPDGMAWIPGGRFWMGAREGEGQADEHPRHPVRLSPYCIDRTEVTVSEYMACVSAGQCTPPGDGQQWSGITAQYRFSNLCNANRSNHEDYPINCVDWGMADRYCRARGSRLPTEAEWEYAAKGGEGRRYPWGDTPPGQQTCWRRWSTGEMCQVGSFGSGASPFGILDMAGNVFEWTSDDYSAYGTAEVSDPTRATGSGEVVGRGGSWIDDDPDVLRSTRRIRVGRHDRHVYSGFRCVQVPH
jgi:formylglycine-generating enzyme required for sulfatase activity